MAAKKPARALKKVELSKPPENEGKRKGKVPAPKKKIKKPSSKGGTKTEAAKTKTKKVAKKSDEQIETAKKNAAAMTEDANKKKAPAKKAAAKKPPAKKKPAASKTKQTTKGEGEKKMPKFLVDDDELHRGWVIRFLNDHNEGSEPFVSTIVACSQICYDGALKSLYELGQEDEDMRFGRISIYRDECSVHPAVYDLDLGEDFEEAKDKPPSNKKKAPVKKKAATKKPAAKKPTAKKAATKKKTSAKPAAKKATSKKAPAKKKAATKKATSKKKGK